MKVLWVDDEIHLLKPHIIFLEKQGVKVIGVDHPLKAIEIARNEDFDIMLVDYKMPQINGLDFAREIKRIHPNIPLVLITMVQDKDIMDEAFSIDVFDYLVKPIQPSQILAVLRKLEKDRLKDKTETKRIFNYYNSINSLGNSWYDWLEKGRLFFNWAVDTPDDELLKSELKEKNQDFANWIEENYPVLLTEEEVPFLFRILRQKIFPLLSSGEKVKLLIFDNFRFDQALEFSKSLPSTFSVEIEPIFSVIPTATQFARNSIFAGLPPYDIERRNPGWLKDNLHEIELLSQNLIENRLKNLNFIVKKINTLDAFKQETFDAKAPLSVYVINFFDMIFHLREEESPLRGLIESAEDYVKLCKFLIESSGFIEKLGEGNTFITTDHGWVKGERAVVIQGGQEVTEGLRFKFGDSLKIIEGKAIEISNLKAYGIPKLARTLLLAKGYDFFVYRTDVSKFKKRYSGGLYHGGLSIEEMIIPLVKLKKRSL